MGYTVLYIAFGVVALWLLGEVLLQYRARLRWRLLAFAGFLGVVAGVVLPSVIVIVVGAAAFGTGQTFVTLSYRRGFVSGWALRRPKYDTDDETSDRFARRRAAAEAEAEAEADGEPFPVPAAAGMAGPAGQIPAAGGAPYAEDAEEVTPFGVGYDSYDQTSTADGGGSTRVFQPMPMSEDSGEFAGYDRRSSYEPPDPYTNGGYQGQGYGAEGYDGWGGGQEHQPAAVYDGSYGWGGQEQGQDQGGYGGYDPGSQQHAYTDPYADPYAGHPQGYGQGQQQGDYQYQDPYQGQGQDSYQSQGQDSYQGQGQDSYQGQDPYQSQGQDLYQSQGQDLYQSQDPYQSQSQGQGQGQGQQGQYGYNTPPGDVWTPGDQQQVYIPQQSQDSQYEEQPSRYGTDPHRYQG